MKLFVKILLLVFTVIIANVNVANAAIVFTDFQEETTSFPLHKETLKAIYKVIENDLMNCCENEQNLLDYRNWGIGFDAQAAKGGMTFNKGVLENFTKHAFAGGRHADLGLSVEKMASKGLNLVEQNMSFLKAGDNTLIGNINGIQKSFKAFVQDGKIISVNMYPGISNRATHGTIIKFGNVKW